MTKVTTKKNKKADQQKLMVRILCGALCVVMIVTTLLAILPGTDLHGDTTYYIDENGNVVTADGTVIGSFEELFGSQLTDEDGHVHVEGEEDHDHAEEPASDVTTDETVEEPADTTEQAD